MESATSQVSVVLRAWAVHALYSDRESGGWPTWPLLPPWPIAAPLAAGSWDCAGEISGEWEWRSRHPQANISSPNTQGFSLAHLAKNMLSFSDKHSPAVWTQPIMVDTE